jgi:hypothetical protein
VGTAEGYALDQAAREKRAAIANLQPTAAE